MAPYVMIHASSSGKGDSQVNPDVQGVVCIDDVLPVFTSLESLSGFVRDFYSKEEPTRPTHLEIDPLKLAIVTEQLEVRAGLKFLVFDPRISSSGCYVLPKDPMSVSAYRLYILELARGTKRLFAEGRAELGDECSSSEEREELLHAWIALRTDKVEADARARMEEWEMEDDSSWRGNRIFRRSGSQSKGGVLHGVLRWVRRLLTHPRLQGSIRDGKPDTSGQVVD
jgi:hypothetical protein